MLALVEFLTRQFLNQGSAIFGIACHLEGLLRSIYFLENLQNQEKACISADSRSSLPKQQEISVENLHINSLHFSSVSFQ